ncbi:MAG: hypothetical protein R3B57_02380 [Phycisphaerales bacterium]
MSNRGVWMGGLVASTCVVASAAGLLRLEAWNADRKQAKQDALATVQEMYDLISGPAGEARDWERFRAMFAEGGRLTFFTQGRPAQGDQVGTPPRMISWTPEEYVEKAGAHMASNPFYEHSTWDNAQVFGRMAHVMSAYETTVEPGGEAVARGVNSFQLVRDPNDPAAGWKVLLICWDTESPERPIPAEMTQMNQANVPTDD